MTREAPATGTPEEKAPSAEQRWSPLRLLSGMVPWIGQHRFISFLIAVAAVVSVVIPLGLYALHVRNLAPAIGETLAEALRLLDERSLGKARELAKELVGSPHLANNEMGGPAFVLGAATTYEAECCIDSQFRAHLYVSAEKYLAVAREHGFPPGREAEGMFLLGTSLYYSRQRHKSLSVLDEALRLGGPHTVEIHQLLTHLHYQDAEPDLDMALQHIQQYLDIEHLSEIQRDDGLLLHSQILFDAARHGESRDALESMSSAEHVRAESLILKGRLLLCDGDRAAQQNSPNAQKTATRLYNDALQVFREVQTTRSVPDQSTRRSAYLIGVAYRKLEDYRAAHKQFDRTSHSYYQSEETVIAGLEKAEMLRRLQRDDEAIEAYREALQTAGPGETFENNWISLSRFVARVRKAYDDYLAAGQYEPAVALARSLSPTMPPSRSLKLLAGAQQAWASSLAREASQLSYDESAEKLREMAAIHRDLGATHERLARFRFATREYPQDVLQSAESFLAGGDFSAAARQYRKFLKGEPTARNANALVGLGQALMSLNRVDEAVRQFRECIEFHEKDPAVYRARLLCAEALMRQNKNDGARQLLDDNLYHSELTPQSTEWRDSLYKLGQINYEESSSGIVQTGLQTIDHQDSAALKEKIKQLELNNDTLQQAIQYLREAVERYPVAPQAVRARYTLGEAYRLSAKLPQAKTETTEIATTKEVLRKEVLANLRRALEVYTSLIEDLTAQQGQRKLSELERTVQRNCYFARGYALDDMGGRDEEAIAAFLDATSRYQRRPEAIEAFAEIASLYRKRDRPLEARGILEQAIEILNRMDPRAEFHHTTRFSRQEWVQYLDWLHTL